LTRALAKIPADRFSTVALFAQAMSPRASLTDAPVGSGHPRWTTAVAISVVGLVAGLGLLIGWRLLTDQGGAIAVVRTTRLATEQGMAFDPALSPDGRLLAYAGGDLQRGTGIYVRQIGGGGAISLAAGRGTRWPRWSRDGAWIAYESAGEIYVISALGGASRRLTQGAFPAWSQDGRRLVFIRGDTLFSLDLEASTPKALTTAFEPSSPAWSPDGSRIAYVVGNENYRDGNVIPSALWILDLATGTAAPVTDSEYVNQSPVWAGDGRALLYVSNRDGSNDVYRLALGRSGAPSGRPRRLTIGAGAWTISATPDGELVAYSVLGESTDIWAFPLRSRPGPTHLSDGRQVTRVGDLSFFDVSPDGMWLAWNAPNGIYKEDMVNGDVTLLADGGKVPSWSPDGREIAFYRFRDGNRDIFVMSADGRNQLALTRSVAQEYAPDWSPDGRSLVFSSTVGHGSAPTELYVVSRPQPNTTAWGAPRKVSADGSWAARWSPDGRFIAYARRRRGGVAPSVAEIGVVTPDGTRDRVLVRVPIREPHPDWIEWSPDSRSVYYLATDAEGAVSLWAAPVAPGAPRRLMSFDRDLDLPPCFDLHGNTVYVSVERTAGHISLVELSRGR
jgi:tricorn protease